MPKLSHDGKAQADGGRYRYLDDESDTGRHGRAALLLVESLIHSLVDKGVMTRGEAIDVIDIATEVEAQLADDPNGGLEGTLLDRLSKTFRLEMD